MRMADRLIAAGMVERTTDPAPVGGDHRIVEAMPAERRSVMVEVLQADAAGEPQVDHGAYGGLLLPGWS